MAPRVAALLVLACLAGIFPDGRALAQASSDVDKPRILGGQNVYTPLAQLLFDQNREIGGRPKIDVLRQLLDEGANVNGNHGGRGRAGALGHARREEPEVIALLVARGATLATPEGGGPISIAIEMERDDLALAERRRDATMAKALLAAGARPVAPAPSGVRPGSDFFSVAAKEVDEVVFFDPPRFALDRGRDAPIAFYGDAMNEFKEVSCERSASFGIIAMANMAGGIRAGICVREVRRVRALAASAQPALAAMLALLSQEGLKLDAAMLDRLGWKYARTVRADGAEEHYFPLIAIGHGIGNLPTLVRVSRGTRRAIVVQADTMKLCENYGLQSQTPLCNDTRRALADIARRLDSRFSD